MADHGHGHAHVTSHGPSPKGGGGGHDHESPPPVNVTVSPTTMISPETKEAAKQKDFSRLLLLFAIDIGAVITGWGLNVLYQQWRLSKEDKEVIEEAKKHAQEGNWEKAFEHLRRNPFGIGQKDEEILDLELAKARKKSSDREKRHISRLIGILGSNHPDPIRRRRIKRVRYILRNTITLEPDPGNVRLLILEYADLPGLTAIENRLRATGKLDAFIPADIPGKVRDGLRVVDNTLQRVEQSMDRSPAVQRARRNIR